MHEKIKALLVHERPEPFLGLQSELEQQAIEVHSAKSCGEAALSLWSEQPPHLVFTDVQMPDGNWADVLTLSRRAPEPTNVIVVSPIVDVQFYIEALERGAFDFIIPPPDRRGPASCSLDRNGKRLKPAWDARTPSAALPAATGGSGDGSITTPPLPKFPPDGGTR